MAASLLLPALPGAGGSAHAEVLVSNMRQEDAVSTWLVSESQYLAQRFHTGDHPAGYNLESIKLNFVDTPPDWDDVTVSLRENAIWSANHVVDFVNPSSGGGVRTFTLPLNTSVVLKPDTNYFVRIEYASSNSIQMRSTETGNETGIDDDWEIHDKATIASVNSGGSFNDFDRPFKIEVIGTEAVAPTISLIELTSDPNDDGRPGDDGTYAIGDTVEATVTFTRAVTVDDMSGNNKPQLELDVGGSPKQAEYTSGSGSTELVFSYTVAENDEDNDGIAIGSNKLTLNGGTIKTLNADAELAHDARSADSDHKVLDAVRPTFVSTEIWSTDPQVIRVTWSETISEADSNAYSIFPFAPATTVTVDGKIVKWSSSSIQENRTYQLQLFNGAVKDLVGNPSAGSGPHTVARFSVPGAPTNLMATASSATAINLGWTAPTDNGDADITGYRIEVSPNGVDTWTDLEDDTESVAVTFDHTGLSAGTTRYYRVSAINRIGPGTPSQVMSARTFSVPDAPANLAATPGDEEVTLTWELGDDGGTRITKHQYKIKKGTEAYGNWIDIDNSGANEDNETSYTVTMLENGALYTFQVQAVNSEGGSGPSDEDSATPSTCTAPGAPTIASVTPTGFGKLTLTWSPPTEPGTCGAIDGYEYQVKKGAGGTYGTWTDIDDSANLTSYEVTLSDSQPSTTFYFKLRATVGSVDGTESSEESGTTWAAIKVRLVDVPSSVREDAGSFTVAVEAETPAGTEPPDFDIDVLVSTEDGSADSGTDYGSLEALVSFVAGDFSEDQDTPGRYTARMDSIGGRPLSVAIVDDGVVEADETFVVDMLGHQDLSDLVELTGDTEQTVTIVDDDHAPVIVTERIVAIVNQAEVGRLEAKDEDGDTLTWSLTGGADQTVFELSPEGVLRFKSGADPG